MIYILLPCFNEYENLKILLKKIELTSDQLKKKNNNYNCKCW